MGSPLQRGWGPGGSDTAPGVVLEQWVAGGWLLQQGGEDALQLGEAGTQGRAGEEVQLVGRVKGQDGDEPPAPRRAIWQSLEGTKGEILTSGAARGTRGLWAALLMGNFCFCLYGNASSG